MDARRPVAGAHGAEIELSCDARGATGTSPATMKDVEASHEPWDLLAHASWVRDLARTLVNDPARADDAVQQTWVAALERPLPLVRNPRAWLAAVLRNAVRQSARSERRRTQRESLGATPEPPLSADEIVQRAETLERVVQAVLALSEPYRSTLLFHYFDGLDSEEIARRQRCSSSTVRNRVKRALERLRQRFDADGDDWRPALLALALPSTSFGPAAATGGAALASPGASTSGGTLTATGGLSMYAKLVLTLATTLLAGIGGVSLWSAGDGPGGSSGLAETPREALVAGSNSARDANSAPASPVVSAPRRSRSGQAGRDGAARKPVERAADPAPQPRILAGIVRDQHGAPVAGAPVFLGGRESPFGGGAQVFYAPDRRSRMVRSMDRKALAQMRAQGLLVGLNVPTDEEGRFQVTLHGSPATPEGVFVAANSAIGLHADPAQGAWYAESADDLEFVVETVPTSSISIAVVDAQSGERLAPATGWVELLDGTETGARARFEWGRDLEWSVDEDAPPRHTFEVLGGSIALNVRVVHPVWAQAVQRVDLLADVHRDVEILVDSGAGFAGRVVDADGRAVEGATVFWGELARMRDNSLYRPYAPDELFEATRTDAAGHYLLKGRASTVSAWHPDHSPASAAVDVASTIRLAARGTIQGRVVGADGAPVAGVAIALDRDRELRADELGRFRIEGVEAGPHGLELGDLWLGVDVPAGGTVEVDPWPELLARVDVRIAADSPAELRMAGVVFGAGRTFRVNKFETRDGNFVMTDALPGSYLLLGSKGHVATFEVHGPVATVDLGSASLEVTTLPNSELYLVPVDATPSQEWVARRSARDAGEEGVVRWPTLPAGTYKVGNLYRDVEQTIAVAGPDTRVALD